jgi:uncharacterized UPF0160 family protein
MGERILRSLGTHDGAFHADEVTACSLLLLHNLVDRSKIVRTRDLKELAKCEYVCDVGGVYNPADKRYDHHQSDYRGNLSSAGMIWADLKRRGVIDVETYDFLNRTLILGVDAHDNGLIEYETGVCSFSHVVSNFVPSQYDASPDVQDEAFFEAVDFVIGHLKRTFERYQYAKSCREKVALAMEKNDKTLIFEESMPWLDNFFELGGEKHPGLFVIMPSGGHWKLRAIPPSLKERMKVRMPLPEKWAGLLNEDLKRVTGIPGAIFCHKGRFTSVWETKEDAMQALKLILEV